ncbi:MAG: hypothetical protein IJ691_10660 [Lachnospiraceae bacterium]|nr:hypothetical protein [Lachnospiraceae bacterium]
MRIEKYTLYDLPLLVISELARDDVRRAQVLAILGISEDEFWAYAWGLEPAYFDWADLGRERPKEPEEEPEPEVVEEPEEEPAEEGPAEEVAEEPEEEPAEEEPEEEEPVEKTYTITVTASEGGTISASASSAKEGEVISLKAVADGGKEIARWEPDGNVTLDFTNGTDTPTFVMPATNVSVHVAYGWATSQNNATPTLYAITMSTADTSKGTVSCDPANAKEGDTVTLTATPNGVYEFAGWTVTSGSVTITNNTFVMPASPVTIDGAFRIAAANLNKQQADGTIYLTSSGATAIHNANNNELIITAMGSDRAVTIPASGTITDSNNSALTYTYFGFDNGNVLQNGDTIYFEPSNVTIGLTNSPFDKNVTLVALDNSFDGVYYLLSSRTLTVGPNHTGNLTLKNDNYTFTYTPASGAATGVGSWNYVDSASGKSYVVTAALDINNTNTIQLTGDPYNTAQMGTQNEYEWTAAGGIVQRYY